MNAELKRLKEVERVAKMVSQIGLGYDGQEYIYIIRKAVKELTAALNKKE